LIFGGILIVAVCLHRTLKMHGSLNCKTASERAFAPRTVRSYCPLSGQSDC
jgi:hypothetical protein